MYFIAHRGLINGPDTDQENKIQTIEIALNNGFDVEVDLWLLNNKFYLGHDKNKLEEVNFNFIQTHKEKLWIHTKNFEVLNFLSFESRRDNFHYFWHQEDNYTITSKNIPWVYSGCKEIQSGILVLPENHMNINQINKIDVIGICSDYIFNIREKITKID